MPEIYRDDAVFIPGRGAVLIAPVGTTPPSAEELKQWIAAGATGAIGDFVPLGYTSLDELPGFDSDTEGGETKGAWENPALRTTQIKTTDSVNVTPIQWSKTPLTHRFGPGVLDTTQGHFHTPAVYTASEVAILIVIIDGAEGFGIMGWKGSSAPGDGIEFDAENFVGLPVKYTLLGQMVEAGSNGEGGGLRKLTVIGSWLMDEEPDTGAGAGADVPEEEDQGEVVGG
ncbi:phage tail tube protein [Corynebacterium sp. AOP12-C2-36]|uniref:phage tail tube protein n=1 Tax=Corynebacterium sp. AOP12-C2-36 TaxID=3457723 RepID=UPI004033EAB6